ncbi:hypothetical protein H3V53_31745 [Paraburkholderia bengalensis]|uniref:Uncharacterized protein n=1 Tax=Paraburkholderia bengalensis TaxID=2747562 RepID=A0ABU8J1B2_9BURK
MARLLLCGGGIGTRLLNMRDDWRKAAENIDMRIHLVRRWQSGRDVPIKNTAAGSLQTALQADGLR